MHEIKKKNRKREREREGGKERKNEKNQKSVVRNKKMAGVPLHK